MDLHLTKDLASPQEQSAVDSVLGKPESGWQGAARNIERDGRAGFSVHSAQSQRHLLLPVLHAVQSRIGWISPGALNYVSLRLNVAPAEVHGVASFYDMFSLTPRPPITVHVCDDIGCVSRGAEQLCAEFEKKLGPANSPCANGKANWRRSPCLGLCERAPAALVSCAGDDPAERVLAPAAFDSISATLNDAVSGILSGAPDKLDVMQSVPQSGQPQLRLLRRIGKIDSGSLQEYRHQGGYEALQRAFELGPERVIREVIDSKLVGRGGAAFPTGKKWEALHQQRHLNRPHFVVCNADESEPGTFKDRVIMEGDPFAVIEGLTIAGMATGAQKGFIYVRGEYPLAAEKLEHAIYAARAANFLGEHILGQKILGADFSFEIEVRRGAGAYICGEETALFNSIEGFRGEPRNKPPFPTQSGLFRRPTVINNVETLINVPEIILMGGTEYAKIGTANSAGYRLFCVSGNVQRPGVYETPFGPTLRNLIEMAGGVSGTGKLKAVLLGGAAGSFVTPDELDTPLTFEGTRAIGASLGSGVIMVFDDSTALTKILLRIAEFFKTETCGQCVPCRVGTMRQEELLQRLARKQPLGSAKQERALMNELAQAMRDASICGLGQTASSAILSAMDRWSLFQ